VTLWRLEWLRLVRTKRFVALMGVYVFFGLLGPTTARYIGEIVERFGEGVVVSFPDPVPADGLAQFSGNANQIGTLVAVFVAASALVVDALPEMAIFLRTRTRAPRQLLWPRLAISYGAVAVAFILGVAIAGYQTTVLLGAPAWGPLAIGSLLNLVYLAFTVALVAAIGSRMGSVVGAVAITIVLLLLLPVVSFVEEIARWSPSHLLGATDALLRDTDQASDYLPALLVTLAATAGLVALAMRWLGNREI
jgi:ABC-2 type transport system permease protein